MAEKKKAEKKKKNKNTAAPKEKEKVSRKKQKEEEEYYTERDLRKRREIQGIIIVGIGIFLAVALFFDITGALGEYISKFLKGLFGLVAFAVPVYLVAYGGLMLAGRTKVLSTLSTIFFIVLMLDFTIFNSVRFIEDTDAIVPVLGLPDIFKEGSELHNGGVIGNILAGLLVKFIGKVGAYIAAAVIALISIIIISDRPYAGMGSWNEERQQRAEKKREAKRLEAPVQEEIAAPVPERKPARPKVPEGYQITDNDRTRKALKQANLDKNQKNILNLMTDDSLVFGNGEDSHVDGFGLDGSQESLKAPKPEITFIEEKKNNIIENPYDLKEEPELPVEAEISGKEIISDVHEQEMDFINGTFRDKLPPKETSVVSRKAEPVEAEDPVKNVEKISNAQAAAATLDKSEFNKTKPAKRYRFPSIELLTKSEVKSADLADLAAKTRKLEETLAAFHVDARVVDAVPGPAVTRYEIQPNTGVKVSSITKLSDDIALNLRAKSIRIEAPIPGKPVVGIEIENDHINAVRLREIIDSREFKNAKSKISFAVGKDIAGKAIVGDLKGMPHMLIAGSTGSGKSVCINSIIASILYKATPDEVKLVLVDPKVVELSNYNGIPHLLIPVVTEPTKAAAALNWAVAEMNDRYNKFAEAGVRELESYNEHVRTMDEPEKVMPQIVIIIDELADLMMAAPSQVEESICRLAQKARAAGMHLIVATQRPSVDVITGVIKANIPSRIAFAVSSQVDSRTILDMSGAEKLVGKGDMLYNPIGMGKPIRVQGCFISDNEVNSVIDFVKSQTDEVEYSSEVMNTLEKTDTPAQSGPSNDGDELMDDCIEFVVHSGQASVSMLQRRFRIGYNRAARIMDMMEAAGIVGPQDGSRPRQVLLTEADLMGEEAAEITEEIQEEE